MFEAYLKSIVIYMIILRAEKFIFKDSILKNGWGNESSSNNKGSLAYLFCVSAVPVFRFLLVLGFFVLATTKKTDIESRIKKFEDGVNGENNE